MTIRKKEYKPKTKKVIQLTLSGDTVKIWNSAREASEELNISISLIRDCCLGKQKTTKGFIFKYTCYSVKGTCYFSRNGTTF